MAEELFTPLFFTQRGQQLGWAMLLLASLLLFYTVVSCFFTWRDDFMLVRNRALPEDHVQDIATAEVDVMATLPRLHLFGFQADEDTDFLPVTSLQLQLTGIINDAENKVSNVIITEAGQPGKIYSVGDELISGIKIYSINQEGVVLERGGHLEKLPLLRARLQFQAPPKSVWQDN